MPIIKNKIFRYKIIDTCLSNPHKLYGIDDLIETINRKLEQEEGKGASVSKRTVRKDIHDIQLPPYNMELDEELLKRNPTYYRYMDVRKHISFLKVSSSDKGKLEQAIKSLENYSGIPQFDWARIILQAITSDNKDSNFSAVEFDNNLDLTGLTYYDTILGAIVNKQNLKIDYKPFGKKTTTVCVSPYMLKQYNTRWFLLCKSIKYNNLTVYALDRIENMDLSPTDYCAAPKNIDSYFDNRIGVTNIHDQKEEEVLLRVSNKRFAYIRTKPIHSSQRVKFGVKVENGTVISLKILINKELESLILSFGNDVEVLAPEHFRQQIKEKIAEMANFY